MLYIKSTINAGMQLGVTMVVLALYSCVSARQTEQNTDTDKPFYTIINNGVSVKIPSNWIMQHSSFIDTLSHTKTGELLPGIVTPKVGTFTGQDFLHQLTAKEEIEFEETSFSFNGMPYDLVKTDSVKLKNTTWYWGVLLYETHTPYQYAYFGDFGKCGVMINFYTETYTVSHEKRFNRILETVEISR